MRSIDGYIYYVLVHMLEEGDMESNGKLFDDELEEGNGGFRG